MSNANNKTTQVFRITIEMKAVSANGISERAMSKQLHSLFETFVDEIDFSDNGVDTSFTRLEISEIEE